MDTQQPVSPNSVQSKLYHLKHDQYASTTSLHVFANHEVQTDLPHFYTQGVQTLPQNETSTQMTPASSLHALFDDATIRRMDPMKYVTNGSTTSMFPNMAAIYANTCGSTNDRIAHKRYIHRNIAILVHDTTRTVR